MFVTPPWVSTLICLSCHLFVEQNFWFVLTVARKLTGWCCLRFKILNVNNIYFSGPRAGKQVYQAIIEFGSRILVIPSCRITLEVGVYCAASFFGPLCDTVCIPQNSCDLGHFTCSSIGLPECLPGWGPAGVCTEAIPTIDQCPDAEFDNSKFLGFIFVFVDISLELVGFFSGKSQATSQRISVNLDFWIWKGRLLFLVFAYRLTHLSGGVGAYGEFFAVATIEGISYTFTFQLYNLVQTEYTLFGPVVTYQRGALVTYQVGTQVGCASLLSVLRAGQKCILTSGMGICWFTASTSKPNPTSSAVLWNFQESVSWLLQAPMLCFRLPGLLVKWSKWMVPCPLSWRAGCHRFIPSPHSVLPSSTGEPRDLSISRFLPPLQFPPLLQPPEVLNVLQKLFLHYAVSALKSLFGSHKRNISFPCFSFYIAVSVRWTMLQHWNRTIWLWLLLSRWYIYVVIIQMWYAKRSESH